MSVTLGPTDLDEIKSVASGIKVQGARYPDELMKLSGR
jgi:hypothetical protein